MINYKIIVSGELPTDCYMCNFFDDNYGFCWGTIDKKDINPVGFGKAIPPPSWCPLISESQLKNIVVQPAYDNAWELINKIFTAVRRDSTSEKLLTYRIQHGEYSENSGTVPSVESEE
jgi:hypothetical protein